MSVVMTSQRLGIEGKWNVLVCYGVHPDDLAEVAGMMLRIGASREQVTEAWYTLSGWNGGVTYTSFNDHMSLVFIGRAESAREFFNTIDHEIDHVQNHVASYYGVMLGTEQAAYLQGFIGGRIWEHVFTNMLNDDRRGCQPARLEYGGNSPYTGWLYNQQKQYMP